MNLLNKNLFNINEIKILKRYSVEITLNEPYFLTNGIVDEENKILYAKTILSPDTLPVFYYRNLNNSYGKSSLRNKWCMLFDDTDFPLYYTEIINTLNTSATMPTICCTCELIKITLCYPLDEILNKFKLKNRCNCMCKNAIIEVDVDRTSLMILRCLIRLNYNNKEINYEIKISPYNHEIVPPMEVALNTNFEKLEKLALFINLKTIGGLAQPVHAACTQRAINFLKDYDVDKKYCDIYDSRLFIKTYGDNDKEAPTWNHHPLVIGSYYEDEVRLPDFYHSWLGWEAKPNNWYSDYNHYGAKDTGLEYSWYFNLRDKEDESEVTPNPFLDDRYFSAKDWGYGDEPSSNYNNLNFKNALSLYIPDNPNGRRNSYLILGHVLHLLQDQGQPDHVALEPHPGSSFNEAEAYVEFKVCTAATVEAAIGGFIIGGIFGAILGAVIGEEVCEYSIDTNEVGYEKFVNDYWKFDYSHWESGFNPPEYRIIDNLYIYREFFEGLGDFSIKTKDKYGLSCPLGLGRHPTLAVDGCDPDINITDTEQKNTYLKLTDELIPETISYCASFLKYFYEISNLPPYVQRVVIIMDNTDTIPIAFGALNNDNSVCKKDIIIYDSLLEYDPSLGMPEIKRSQKTQKDIPLSSDKQGYIFVAFGPKHVNGTNKSMEASSVHLNINGRILDGENYIDTVIPVTLAKDIDDIEGEYYWGKFVTPSNIVEGNLTIEISANDNEPHLLLRKDTGKVLQSNAKWIPHIDVDDCPTYQFKEYIAGLDSNHIFSVIKPDYTDSFEDNNSFDKATPLIFNNELWNVNFEQLSLPDSEDKDYLFISLQDVDLKFYSMSGDSEYNSAGLHIRMAAPKVNINITDSYGYCYNFSVYTKSRQEYENFNGSGVVAITPGPIGKEFYLVLSNGDFKKQGAISYSISAYITEASFSCTGGLLNELNIFKNKISPCPGPDDYIVTYGDPAILVNDLKNSIGNILDIQNVTDTIERKTKEAEYFNIIGNIAENAQLYKTSEGLYINSYELYAEQNNTDGQINALDNLQRQYTNQQIADKLATVVNAKRNLAISR